MKAAAWIVALLLAAVAVRRFWWIAAGWRRPPVIEAGQSAPHTLILAPMRNEQERGSVLLESLSRLDYPKQRHFIVLGDDASSDGTAAMLHAWASSRPNVLVVRAEQQVGKAELMTRMMNASGKDAPFVAVYDAKHGPTPDSLRQLIAAMQDEATGCASGYLEPQNAHVSLVSQYSALESWVTQLVHHGGKESQGQSAPSLGGNCVYRRAALEQIGGFPAGALSEDTEVSLAMQAHGWRTRFVAQARATNLVVETVGGFWLQRLRWSRGLAAARHRAKSMEAWAVTLGYADRLLFLAAAAMAVAGYLPVWMLLLYATAPLAMILSAVHKAHAWRDSPRVLLAIVLLAPVDIAVSLWATIGVRRVNWR